MSSTRQLFRLPKDWLLASCPLAAYVGAFARYLCERGHASITLRKYLGCLAHFGRWMSQCQLNIECIDEELVSRFLDEHLPQCDCARPVCRNRVELRAALGHLLHVLRAEAVIPEAAPEMTPVNEELRRFDAYMDHVQGLAPKTRSMHLLTVGRLLREQFADQPVVISALTPEDLRRFVAFESERYSSPGNAASMISALRGYFRFRTTYGDQVHGLIGVLAYPIKWKLSSLPKALSSAEVERLEASLGGEGPSARRSDAMVRCALDLGLRRGEVAGLSLDDIDWRAGTITLRRTKSRREDCLPLPAATARAIADYLRLERPQTDSRAVFVRHGTPRGRPIGPDCVGKTIRQAYARAGLPYTGAHLLRHTMASRLLAGGSSLKEVGRCAAPSLPGHHADLRQARQP
jgi:integrase/recombinase XerC